MISKLSPSEQHSNISKCTIYPSVWKQCT